MPRNEEVLYTYECDWCSTTLPDVNTDNEARDAGWAVSRNGSRIVCDTCREGCPTCGRGLPGRKSRAVTNGSDEEE